MNKKKNNHKARTSHYADISAGIEVLDEILLMELVDRTRTPFLLVLDQVQDPHNLGACLRTANAAGVHAVVMPRRRSAPLSETVKNIAAGAAERTPVARVTNLARTLRDLKDYGIRIVGTDHRSDRFVGQEDLTGPLAIVLGSEGEGIRRLTADTCDALVSIPMRGTVECLNVSVATGVCLFEALRQRISSAE